MQENGRKQVSKVSSRVEELLGIVYPIIQAPFGGFASQRLAAAVSNLGGLGSLGVVSLNESAIRDAVVEMLSLTNKPFAVNLWVSTSDPQLAFINHDTAVKKIVELAQYYADLGVETPSVPQVVPKNFKAQCYAAINAGAPVLSFVYGIPPAEIVTECRQKSVRTIATATTPEEALELERAGIDLIVASGFEGGGHRGSFLRSPVQSLMGSFSLISQVVDAVQIPVVAAGGIADGRGLKAALALGAEGVQIGTAFLACAGSGANTSHREALLSKDTTRTELTDKFTGRLARGINNHLMDELNDIDSTVMPFPLQHALVQTVAQPASMRGRADLMTLWAGQSVGLCHHAEPAELMTELIAALEDIRKSEFEELGKQSETASRYAGTNPH
jgi:nitronate monooxygenase